MEEADPVPARRVGFFRVRQASDQGSGHTETHCSMATFNTLTTSAGRGKPMPPKDGTSPAWVFRCRRVHERLNLA